MSLNDSLASALAKINNAEKVGKTSVVLRPISKMILKVLEIMKQFGYIGEYSVTEQSNGSFITLTLIGKINTCNVIKPRFPVQKDIYEKFEKRYLLAKGFGFLIVSTSKGVMTQDEAIEKNLGGRLIAYCY